MGARVSVERLEELRTRQEGHRLPAFAEFTQLVDEVSELRALLAPIRALGAPAAESVRMAAQLFAAGVSEKQALVYSKASSSGVLGVGEQLLLREAGVRVEPSPDAPPRQTPLQPEREVEWNVRQHNGKLINVDFEDEPYTEESAHREAPEYLGGEVVCRAVDAWEVPRA